MRKTSASLSYVVDISALAEGNVLPAPHIILTTPSPPFPHTSPLLAPPPPPPTEL